MEGPEAKPIRLVIVDDHAVVRLGLMTALARHNAIQVVGEAATVAEAWTELDRHRPDVLLMDVRLPDGNGVIECRDMRAKFPQTGIVFLTSYPDEAAVLGAVFAGAAGYLLKDVGREELVETITKVARGQSVLDPPVIEQVLSHMRHLAGPADGDASLSALRVQEQKVLALVAEGLSNKEIGRTLRLSEKTVRNYLYRVFKKLRVKRRSQAMNIFLQRKPVGNCYPLLGLTRDGEQCLKVIQTERPFAE